MSTFVRAAEVDVKKHVETKHVEREVPLTHEKAIIDRRPVREEAASGEPRITSDEIHLPLMAEEVVTEKRIVPKEAIVITKTTVREAFACRPLAGRIVPSSLGDGVDHW